MYDGVYFWVGTSWSRTRRGLPGAILSPSEWSHLPSHFSLSFLFPESCPWYTLWNRSQGRRVALARHLGPAELGTLLLLLPPPWAGGRLSACVSLFHLIPTLCGGIPVAGHERGCNRVGYVKSSAQASAVHDACQGLWSTDTCAPGYSTKYRSHIELCVSVCCSSE